LALDRDQARTGVWCTNRKLDLLAGRVVAFGENQLELGVLLQRARDIRLAGDLVVEARELLAVLVAHDVREAAGSVRRKPQRVAFAADAERLLRDRDFLAAG